MTQPFIITTSWDDGHALDWRLVELFDKYHIRATFYIARDFLSQRLSEADIRDIAQRHEIGAHTLTHPVLTDITPEQAEYEIVTSKQWLEDVTGQAITSFCYPKGFHNATVRRITQDAGYKLARSVRPYQLDAGDDAYAMPTTVQIYPFPLRPLPDMAIWRGWRTRSQPLRQALPHMRRLQLPLTNLHSWAALAIALLDRAAQTGGIWHLWGHSWEIEQYQMWQDLITVLEATRRYSHAQRLTNSDIILQATGVDDMPRARKISTD